ncbi:MAG: hypothetical protein A3F10_05975 [Coxiella sp. RIFCSPHIGHO2_12_FULL_42_15]|nr:MAG: hypothetical protein A3F10_05975 [Coxiella sp. RIFCSPHIGHO2_12_FULL_42_15]
MKYVNYSKYVLLALLVLPLSTLAVYDINIENDTEQTFYLKPIVSSDLQSCRYSAEGMKTLAPYQRTQIGCLNYDQGLKAGKKYFYNVEVYNDAALTTRVMTLQTTVQANLIGSTVVKATVKDAYSQAHDFFSRVADTSKTYWQHINGDLQVYATPVKYTVPNPHMNFQDVDGMFFVIQAPEKTFQRSKDPNHLTILSYNMQLWPFYGWVGGMMMNRPNERIKEIANKTQNYDVVVAGELMDRDLRNRFSELMRAPYPYQYGPIDTSATLSGGVMIYSHWPIEKQYQQSFNACHGIDCSAAKGFLVVSINKNGKRYHILGSHTQADEGTNPDSLAADRAARDAQLQELAVALRQQNIPVGDPVILVGDLNVDAALCQQKRDCSEFNYLLQTVTAQYQPYSNIAILPYTSNYTLNAMNIDPVLGSYDYVLPLMNYQHPILYQTHVRVMRGVENPKMYTGTPYGNTDLSDHFALEAELRY